MQLSPCHAGLAEPQFQRLLSVLGFVGRLLSPRSFEFRLAADPRISSESYPSMMGMLHELLRRTGRWRQSAAGGCSAKPPRHVSLLPVCPACLLDYLICQQEQGWGHRDPERLRGLEI